MELFDATFRSLDAALGAASTRQQVISRNIANVNTPDFKRSDVNFEEALAKAVDDAHSGDASALDRFAPEVVVDNASTMRADGNNVDVDVEMANLAENNVRYNALVQMAAKKIHTLEYVISDGKR